MISRSKNSMLATTMLDNKLFFVEAEPETPGRLLAAGEIVMKNRFDVARVSDTRTVTMFAEDLNSLIDRYAVSARFAAFSLDRRMVLLRRLKIDRDLKGPDVSQQIDWELEQFLISARKEYHINFERFSGERDPYDFLILAAVRKPIVQSLMEIFKQTPLTLKAVDIDVLALTKGLFVYKCVDPAPGLAVVIAFLQDSIEVLLLKDNAFVMNASVSLRDVYGRTGERSNQAEATATLVNEQILGLLDTLGDEVLLKNIENIYLLNGKTQVDVVSSMQRLQRTARVQFVEPLKNVQHSLTLEEEKVVDDNPLSFLALLGLLKS
jgi:hypothetical protein